MSSISLLGLYKSMESIQFKKWEIWLKEAISLPYYLITTIAAYLLSEISIILAISYLIFSMYVISLIYWNLYKSFIVKKSENGYLKLYSYLFTLQTLLCSLIIYIAEF